MGASKSQRSEIKLESVSSETAAIAAPCCPSQNVNIHSVADRKRVGPVTDGASENDRSIKKKENAPKFYCDDFPPCNLSFTRSEHLARHIRKHTGERPFECHCSRKFSRLDNLRQHAQTVHQNEDIPEDSLAAAGYKHQRKVRKDRVRPPGGRARGNTTGSQTGPIRGHKRNSWSTSSMSSTGSAYSNSHLLDRKRPHPLLMATNELPELVQEASGPLKGPNINTLRQHPTSPMRLSSSLTPAFTPSDSKNLATKIVIQPPHNFAHSQVTNAQSLQQTSSRRLSVPSSIGTLVASSPGASMDGHLVDGNIQHFPSLSTHLTSSPMKTTTSKSETWPLRETAIAPNEMNRRRTWHPETRPIFGQGTQVSNSLSVPQDRLPQPLNAPDNQPSVRLPGIESFDPLYRPNTPPHCETSFSMTDTSSQTSWPPQEYRHGLISPTWEHGISKNMHQLQINGRELINSHICDWYKKMSTQTKDLAFLTRPGNNKHDYALPLFPKNSSNERYTKDHRCGMGHYQSSQLPEHSVQYQTINSTQASVNDKSSTYYRSVEHRASNISTNSAKDNEIRSVNGKQNPNTLCTYHLLPTPLVNLETHPLQSAFPKFQYMDTDKPNNDDSSNKLLRLDTLITAASR
ncbi:putative c2h2 transcription factor [Golovinomyces cichoracearum]|uniref:Putative c2h2 transcription factor n=1 Tax=Golovinomyces cichoracearum TaxID=62708 RepID=A0A420J540_9PEZI|nr:putative c2h2 transcription factor [Golovinomyces cichoracearum]